MLPTLGMLAFADPTSPTRFCLWHCDCVNSREYRNSPNGRRDLRALVGERGAAEFRALTNLMTAGVGLMILSLVLIRIEAHRSQSWPPVVAVVVSVAGLAVYLAAYIPISRTVSRSSGRSAWWCANHMPTSVVRFVVWLDGLHAETGSRILVEDPERDAALSSLRRKTGSLKTRTLGLLVVLLIVIALALASTHSSTRT